jgi:hypothetical protein
MRLNLKTSPILQPSDVLLRRHLDRWTLSGLNARTVDKLGVRSSVAGNSIVIPFFSLRGEFLIGYKARLDEGADSQKFGERALPKSISTAGVESSFFYPHINNLHWSEIATDTTIPIFITEGEKKAAKLCAEGFPSIGIGGIYGWTEYPDELKYPRLDRPSKSFNDINWKKRTVYIVFDGDKHKKSYVLRAESHLEAQMKSLGANVKILDLPEVEGSINSGVDDYLQQSGREYFLLLVAQANYLSHYAR